MMRRHDARWAVSLALALLVAGCAGDSAEPEVALKSVKSFDSIEDEAARSEALFVEAGRVIRHPRCLNCHPLDAHPRQGDMLAMHQPPVVRGDDGHGVGASRCDTCHQSENVDHARMPGHPDWHLAPSEMGWLGLSLGEICAQLKDPQQNGGMSLDEIHEHMAEDPLVGWGWSPDAGREPAPGDQESFGRLIRAWIDTGAHCPDDGSGEAVPAAVAESGCEGCHL